MIDLITPYLFGILLSGVGAFLCVAVVRLVVRAAVPGAKDKSWYGPALRLLGILLGALIGLLGRVELFATDHGAAGPLVSTILGGAAGYLCRHIWDRIQGWLKPPDAGSPPAVRAA